ncbi:MAG: ABC transporter ATP-binding protein [Bowdeniella nasicola]|nr:ABC transporter ATP-binding protein [Bowdeniella nasicola]
MSKTKSENAGPALGGQRGRRRRGMPGEKAQNFLPSARRLLGTLKDDALRISVVVLLGVISVGLTVAGPKILGEATNVVFAGFISRQVPATVSKAQLVDQLNAAGQTDRAQMLERMDFIPGSGIDFHRLATLLAIVLAVYVVASLFALVQSRLLNVVVQGAMHRLRMQVEDKLARLPLRYTDSVQRGELLSRVTNDVDNIGQTLQQTLSQVITSLLTVIGVLAMMVSISPLLSLVAFVTIPLTVLVTTVVAKRSQPQFVAQWKETGVLNSRIEETYSGHALVKVYGHQARVKEDFASENARVYHASFAAQFISGVIMPAMTFIGNLVYVAIAVVGGLQVASGQLSIGSVQAFIQYSRQFTQPLGQLGSMANLLQSGVASAERVFELLDEEEQTPDHAAPTQLPAEAGRIEFRDVSFRYQADTPLIEHLNLIATPGSTTAIVGATGAGKTTLVNLIMRFYEIDDGVITLGCAPDGSDAVDIRELTRHDLRSRTGMVLQDTWLFAGTIADNIRYGRPDASDAEVRAAAKAAYVDRFVSHLPQGYDTVCAEEGESVSAGERQLITIARAFLANPRILILDEATSSVDTRTEVLIQQAMADLRQNRTSFVIAHRLSTIRDADQIVVMDAGRIVEQGNHDQLLAKRGAYWKLYQAQFAGPMITESDTEANTH